MDKKLLRAQAQPAPLKPSTPQARTASTLEAGAGRGPHPSPAKKINRPQWLYPALLIGAGFFIVGVLGLFAWTRPALASIGNTATQAAPTRQFFAAPVTLIKPTTTPVDPGRQAPQPEESLASPTFDPLAMVPTDLPILAATPVSTGSPEPAAASGGISMEIVPDTPESPSLPAPAEQESYPAAGNGERLIDVDLSEQRLYAYEGDVIVNSFLVSTGVAATPTVTGRFKIWIKVRIQDMSGPGYYLRDVPYVMYFYDEYGLHGTYWHNNFGTPMSRGCVNLRVEDAQWLFGWASVGTVVNVHD